MIEKADREDVYLAAAQSHLKLAHRTLQARQPVLELVPGGMLLRERRIAANKAMLVLLEELLGIIHRNPRHWEEEPDEVPF